MSTPSVCTHRCRMKKGALNTAFPCARSERCQTQPHHRLRTNPAIVYDFILHSQRPVTRLYHQGSGLQPPTISRDLTIRDYFEIGGRLREIQIRTLMQALSAPARRVNNIDRHSAWVGPETLEWSRVVLSGTLARNGETQQ